ncbi:MAG: CoA-binding protein [Desulfobacterales bacterium]|nr:CoA-binding protein [Desulfobacterales bacterium]
MNFTPLFKPDSMAVAGVSLSNDRHPANVIYNKIHLRYPVKVYPVNPKGGVFKRDRVYRTMEEIPGPVDLAAIAVRADLVPETLAQCIRKGVGGAVIISGGFAESGRADLQERITAMAREADFPFIGPNCLGIYSPGKFDTFFLPGERLVRPSPGSVGFVSQSGGVLVDQMVKFAEQGLGLSLAVSIGNKALIRETDLLRYLAEDPATTVIAFYVEGFGRNEGRAFVELAAGLSKPVIVLKAGKTAEGSRAVSSHTASLAGDYKVFADVLAQHGIVEARNEFELTCFCESLSHYPRAIEGNVGVVTVSGGHGALATDICADIGLQVPRLSDAVKAEIRSGLSDNIRDIASLENPVDLTGSAVDEDFEAAVSALGRAPEVDCLLLLLLPYSPGISSDLGARLSYVHQQTGKPLVAYVPHVIEGFELNNVPVASSIDGAAFMVEAMRRCRPC